MFKKDALKKTVLTILFFAILFLSIRQANAADVISSVLDPFKGFDFTSIYDAYQPFIDFVLWTLLLIGVAQFSLSKVFKGNAGKIVIITVGIALSIAITIWMTSKGYTIASLHPIAVLVLMVILGIFLYNFLNSFDLPKPGIIAFSILFIFYMLKSIFPAYFQWMQSNVGIVYALLNLGVVFSIIILIWQIIKSFGSAFKRTPEDDAARRAREEQDAANENRIRREELVQRRDEELIGRLNTLNQRLGMQQQRLTQTAARDANQQLAILAELGNIINEMRNVMTEITRIRAELNARGNT